MDSSGDSSFVSFKHFPELDVCLSNVLEDVKKSETRRTNILNKLKTGLQNLMEMQETSLQANTHNTRKKISTSKADLESKLQAINELKIKSEILESEINKINEEVSQKNIEDLLREVLTLENEKKQELEKLKKRRDNVIKFMEYYKQYLDCYLTFTKPDIYTFYFYKKSENGKLPNKWLQVRTDDYKYWQFIDATVSTEEKEILVRLLEKNGSIQEVLCRARKMCR
ncbi:uncharacterized protein [Rhodnius prolixus]|uniref:uncharacterized protein n=1 Tax=Rhodnius prolixus TaxID=13249 RepID=UPI003D18A5C4